MTMTSQAEPTTKTPHFATLLLMALAPEQVGLRIKQARDAKGWTHERLAREMDVGVRTVQRWQKGRNPKDGKSWLPRLGTLMELADILEVPRAYFVETELDANAAADVADRLDAVQEAVEGQTVLLAELLQIVRGEGQTSRDGPR